MLKANRSSEDLDMQLVGRGSDQDYIMKRLLPEWIALFEAKSADYRDKDGFEPHKVLGEAGQFAEIWRKIWKLKKAMWDREELTFEPKRVVLLELIGHCFLALAVIDNHSQDKPCPENPY